MIVLAPRHSDCASLASPALTRQVADLSPTQSAHAAAIVNEGTRRHVPDQGIVIALAVAHQESDFLNYANDGRGEDLDPFQAGVGASLEFPHDAVGSDHGSLGLFQQQWPWWGGIRQLVDPGTAAAKVYVALGNVRGWQHLPVTVAA